MTTPVGSTTPLPTATSSTNSPSTTASTAAQASVDYNSFLQLLVQELKNQDPTSPSDPTQYLSQIATFSNVQQAVQTNSTLNSLLTTSSLSQAEGAVGKTVSSADGTVSGKVTSVALNSSGVATATLANGSTLNLDSTVTFGS
ncbi:MAG TPA: flagellar hook assembly protein FlgD [Lichenihabitans sp.]|jgi:flagellar basal-body rod modification protein FlgD|nr:flagellar hook assembly protein FlgD [Lichenihabitans sp.]